MTAQSEEELFVCTMPEMNAVGQHPTQRPYGHHPLAVTHTVSLPVGA
jgi:hypothetical protein